ncbi:MAG: GAF domain-containing protein [Myxococcota bacterium]
MPTPTPTAADALRWERRARELLQRLAVDVSRAADLQEALQAMLRAVCAYTGWPVGHVYERAEGTDTLVSARIWHLDDPDAYATFRRISEASTFASGIGMPGRVLASGRPVWIMDVTVDPNFPRARLAEDLGTPRSGFPWSRRGASWRCWSSSRRAPSSPTSRCWT